MSEELLAKIRFMEKKLEQVNAMCELALHSKSQYEDVLRDIIGVIALVPTEINIKAICQLCNKEYTDGVLSKYQASDCSSHIVRGLDDRWYLTCHYGSKFDSDMYEVMPGTIDRSFNPVCDDCVDKLLKDGAIKLLGDYLHDDGLVNRIGEIWE